MRDPVDITNEEDEDDSFLSAWSSSPVERKTNRLPADTPGSSPGKRQKMTAQFRQQQQSSPLVKQTPYSTTKTAATTSTSFHDDGLLLQPLMESSDPVIPATCTKDSSAEQQKRSASSVIFQSRSKRALGTPDYGQAEIDVQFQNEIQHAMSSQVSLRASTQDAIAPEPPRRELFLQSQDSVLDASDPIEENNELPGAEPISSNAEAVQKSLVEEIPPPRSSVLMVEDPMEEEPMANPEPTNLNSSVENLIPQDDRTASPPSTQLMVEAEDTPVDRGSSKRPASSPTKSEELMPPPARKTSKPPQKKMRVVAPEFHFSQEKQVREDPAIGMHKFKQEYLDAMSSGSSPKPVDASQSSQSVANATEHASSPPQTQHDQDSGSTEQFAQRVPDLSSLFSNGGSLFRPGLSPPAQGSPAMSTAPGMQSTPSPTAQSIYYDFKAAYPSYAGTMSHFVSLCRKLEEARRTGKAVHKSLYDDYIFRHASEYRTHVQERMSLGEDPVPYGLWYEEEVDEPGCFKKVVNANTLEVAVDNGGEGNNDTCEAGKGKRKGRLVTSGGAASLAGSKRTHGDGSSPARRSEKRLPAQRMGTPGSEFDGNVASAENSTKKAEEQEKNKGSPVTKKPRTEKIHEPVSGLPAQSIQESSPVSPPFLGRREQQVLREKRSNTRADKVEKLQASPAEEDVEMTIVSEGGTITKGKVVTSVAAPARPKPTRVSPRTKKDSMKVAEIQRQGIEEATKKEMTKEKGMRGQIGKASPINTSTALVGTVDGGLNQNSPSPLKKRTFVEVRIPVQPRTKRQSIPWLRTEKSSQYSGGDQAKRKSERVVSSKPPTTTSTNATPTKSTNSAAKAASPLPSSRAPAKHSPHPSPTVQKQSQAPQSGIAATAKNRSTSSRLASAGSNGHNVSSPKKPTKRTQPSRESEVSEDRWWEDDSTPFRQFVKHYSKVKKVRHSAPRPPVEATDALDNTGVAKGIDGGPIDVLKWDFRSTL
ncbi:hypothetical protein BDY21DRAFT_174390 [Lineolata rhizophorae]|uniref:Uncharacterized protein n=1 Tax=Lineolata rhizophorae TaxID=578093 RepID=A0A6A6NM83_9PEZI|nr:hypothetical protein BDY21DRAFT_174390 [Lineolata rhizophorae]